MRVKNQSNNDYGVDLLDCEPGGTKHPRVALLMLLPLRLRLLLDVSTAVF